VKVSGKPGRGGEELVDKGVGVIGERAGSAEEPVDYLNIVHRKYTYDYEFLVE
jgi:hypothetical protein